MLRATLAKASGAGEDAFPILVEQGAVPRRAIFVGATQRGGNFLRLERKPPFDTAVGMQVRAGAVLVRSERRDSVESAASWFLEKTLGAHWFMPGQLGEHVPRRDALVLAASVETVRPGFISRDLSEAHSPDRDWRARNRLEPRFEHGHSFASIFQPDDFAREPEMAPMRAGQRHLPETGDANWQPDLLSAAAVRHAAAAANRAFDADPKRLSFSLIINDSVRYDDSAATLAAASPARFFRHRPDYSDVVFGFTNAVAEAVARRHPDRWLPAYAYYWCENAPSFPIARNVVPFLTADRSQWSYPEFAAEDRALIERWCRSGAEVVGVYDYFYGAPFLTPRPTLYAVAESIPFHYRAGVRAFYAETFSNWALDGPKAWLAAQLLWSPERNPAELLDIYYREFWAEAAEPMREFFGLCDRTWKEQPGPPLWLRYFKDDDQPWIYPVARRAELREWLARAEGMAQSEIVRARVAFVRAGFSVSEAFWTFGDARERLSRLARTAASPEALLKAWKTYRQARADFAQRYDDVRRDHPLAIAPQDLEIYFRNEPDSRAARELTRTVAGRALLREADDLPRRFVGATGRDIADVLANGVESLVDPAWQTVSVQPVGSSAAIEWTDAQQIWRGSGEPWEGRTVQLTADLEGPRVLRFASCRTEGIGQWVPVTAGALYAAQVNVRAKSSPGTATFLIMAFLDETGRHIGLGRVDRLPPESSVQEAVLCVIAKAPPNARFVGFGVRVLNQINDDFAEFSGASLRRLEP